jgi:phosphoglycerate dehydrogenase-like enzyme
MTGSSTDLRICFAHPSYRLGEEFAARGASFPFVEARTPARLEEVIGEADVLCVSGLWRPELLARANRLRLIQATSAGVDQFDAGALAGSGIRLCSARGVNAPSVAEHAMALMLAIVRQLPQARDRQAERKWRGMISDRAAREGELRGRKLVIVGYGTIGRRVAGLALAFGMDVVAVARKAGTGQDGVQVIGSAELPSALADADMVCLTCSLNESTRGLFDRAMLSHLRRTAWLINLSRGAVVVEADLVDMLEGDRIGGAALDCFESEPLAPSSPLWSLPNVLITPHTGGETDQMERRFVDLLLENLSRLTTGRDLVNEVRP